MIEEQFQKICGCIKSACGAAGRNPDQVQLLAVTDRRTPEQIQEAVTCGITIFGESRIYEAKQKIPICPGQLSWHFLGHLQMSKVPDAIALFEMIHSVNSLELLKALDKDAEVQGTTISVCLEINVAQASEKFGLAPESIPEIFKVARNLKKVDIIGFSTQPPVSREPEQERHWFRELAQLRDKWREETGFPLPELAMGTDHDFVIAIEEGATLIKLGRLLFEKFGAL